MWFEKKPKDFETFLCLLEQEGYCCKRGKYISLRKEGQQSYIRLLFCLSVIIWDW